MNRLKKAAAFTIILCTLLSSMAGCNNIRNIDSETTSSGKITVNDTTNNNEIGVKNELTVENEILFTDDTTTQEEIISENAEDSAVDNNENIKKEYSKKYTNVEIEYEPILDAYMDMAVKTENFGNEASLIKCNLETGRTHQIRVHLSSLGHNLLGDKLYVKSKKIINKKIDEDIKSFANNFNRQALHAKSLGFIHPTTKEKMFFETNIPEDMMQLMSILRKI